MKVFKRNKLPVVYTREQDMERIISYLNTAGTVYVDNEVVEKLYLEYCREVHGTYWMMSNEHVMFDFARWLENYNM